MRKWLLVLLLVGALAVVGCAKEAEARGGPKKDICDTALASIMNECQQFPEVIHPTSDKRSAEVGVGIDLILYEDIVFDLNYKITGEYKYDWNNGEHQAYAVVEMKLQDVINKVKKLVKKDE